MATSWYWTAERLNTLAETLWTLGSYNTKEKCFVITGRVGLARRALTHYLKVDPNSSLIRVERGIGYLVKIGVVSPRTAEPVRYVYTGRKVSARDVQVLQTRKRSYNRR